MSWVSEVTADSPSLWARLAETAGTSAADQQGATGTYVGGFTLNQPSLLNAAAGDRAAAFDGRSGYVRFPDSAALDRGDTFALEAWINPTSYRDSAGIGGTILDKGSGAFILRFANTLDGRVVLRRNGVADVCTSTARVPLNAVTHVMATKTGATVRIYFNGVDVTGTVTNSTMVNNAIALGIGAADAGVDNFFAGTIDEAVIYPTALSAARALAHYQAGVQVFGSATVSGAGTPAATGKKAAFGTAAVTGGGSPTSSATKAAFGAAACTGGGAGSSTGRKGGFGSANVTGGGDAAARGIRDLHVSPPTIALIVRHTTNSVVQGHETSITITPVSTRAEIVAPSTRAQLVGRSSTSTVQSRSTRVALQGRTTRAVIHA